MKTLLLISLLMASSCATVFKGGSTDKVSIRSDQPETRVYIDGQHFGLSPIETVLTRKDTHTVEFRKEGYETRTTVMTSSIGVGWLILDVIFGLIPVAVDGATGNWLSIDNPNVAVSLEKKSASAANP